ncbi:hypothetical protein [Tenuibacillus multivorans]|uniref:hypothetical protein n=1 Tax=Tenuibacillus multivorans TaxID=237069 RepID=UPI000B892A03|nr:hypothetical protein [Tenuibacillus multivorans]GEL76441.1 hypothetical protein TMU01_06760 [Tenuibacillus multivorans]
MNNIKISALNEQDPEIESIGRLYCTSFIGGNFSSSDLNQAIENIKKHSNYEGFKGLKPSRMRK